MAAENGVFYLEPDTAKIILATRTPFGIAIQIGGYATGGAAVGTQLAKAGSPLVAGFSIASAILGWLLPAMEHNAADVAMCRAGFARELSGLRWSDILFPAVSRGSVL